MDIVLILPLAALFFLQAFISMLLLAPRGVSKQVAALLSLTHTSTVAQTVLHTSAVIILAVTVTSIIQALGVSASLSGPQYADRMMALTIEELRALLTVVLGAANLALLFVNRALGDAQQSADKAALNLQVLKKQAMGLQSFMAAQDSSKEGGGSASRAGAPDSSSTRSEVSKLIAEKQQLLGAVDDAKEEAGAAVKNLAAVKAQAQGLEREYDRLLAENDGLKRKLARLGGGDGQFASGDKKSA